MLSGVNGVSPWAVDASESAGYLVEVALGRYFSGMVVEWSHSDGFDAVQAASSMPDHPMSGLMVALSLIGSLAFLHLVLGSLLTSLWTFGMIGGGVMLILMFGLIAAWCVWYLLLFFFFAHQPGLCWRSRRWGHVDHVGSGTGDGPSCRGFCSAPRAEFLGSHSCSAVLCCCTCGFG